MAFPDLNSPGEIRTLSDYRRPERSWSPFYRPSRRELLPNLIIGQWVLEATPKAETPNCDREDDSFIGPAGIRELGGSVWGHPGNPRHR